MSSSNLSPEPAMLALFRSELSTQILMLGNALVLVQSKAYDETLFEKMILIARSIRGGASILQFNAIVEMAKALEDFFSNLHRRHITLQDEKVVLIDQLIAKLKAFLQFDDKALVEKATKLDKEIENLLSAILSELPEGTKPYIPIKKAVLHDILSEPTEEESLIDPAMMELFKVELENQTKQMNSDLIALEQKSSPQESLEGLMRAAHSIKGAARVVGLPPLVKIAHAMEDCFVAAQNGILSLDERHIDILLKAVDLLSILSRLSRPSLLAWLKQENVQFEALISSLESMLSGNQPPEVVRASKVVGTKTDTLIPSMHPQERIVRVTAKSLNRLMGLAGESMVESRWLQPFSDSLSRLKKDFSEVESLLDIVRKKNEESEVCEATASYLSQVQNKSNECRQNLADRLSELELFINRHSSLSGRLYQEVIESRMRSFGDGVDSFPRMIRDMARQLNKKVRLEIYGKSTPVDRDILDKLETPIAHLLRNALDHGIEMSQQRIAEGKPPEGLIRLEAEHRGGMLSITVFDDGRGIDLEKIRMIIVQKEIAKPEIASQLTEKELVDFLFLPGFTTAEKVTEISGRGVGLNVVYNMLQEVSGNIHVTFTPGKGVTFHLQLPLTLSVMHALIVEISKEPYAFPLGRIERATFVPRDKIYTIENKQYFYIEENNVGLVSGSQILGVEEVAFNTPFVPVVIITEGESFYGIVVDRFLGEKELVVQDLDSRLGKVEDVSSGAFLEDGSPILILDVEDMVRSIDRILSGGQLTKLSYSSTKTPPKQIKRILVVDDSITVREVECRLLRNYGYEVDTAINGVDAWNALKMGNYDLVVTDVDMPRLNGIELVRAIKADSRLKSLPVMIVSYKESEEDRLLGLEAGANYYLTKSSFHDRALIDAVVDLIGKEG